MMKLPLAMLVAGLLPAAALAQTTPSSSPTPPDAKTNSTMPANSAIPEPATPPDAAMNTSAPGAISNTTDTAHGKHHKKPKPPGQ